MVKKDIDWTIDINGCWICTSHCRCNGYPKTCVDGKAVSIARLMVQEKYNTILSSGMYVIHSCDNKACINPDHLSIGDHKDNINDWHKRGNSIKKQFDPLIPKLLRIKEENPQLSQSELGKILGVSKGWVQKTLMKERSTVCQTL